MSICIMSTLLTGGTKRHYAEMAETYSHRCLVVLAEYLQDVIYMQFLLHGDVVKTKIMLGKFAVRELDEELRKHDVKIIHLHHFIYMCEDLRLLLMSRKYTLAVTLHDYYTVCPRINMTFRGVYCRESGSEKCNECMEKHEDNIEPFRMQGNAVSDIHAWRRYFDDFLQIVDYVFVPSADQRSRLLRYFPTLAKIRVVENPEIVLPRQDAKKKPLRIGILGGISAAKGRAVLLRCARLAEQKGLNIRFILFGTLEPPERGVPDNLLVKGRYTEAGVYEQIRGEQIDFFWFTAVWPETYSYVLTIPIRMGIPVIAADIGAIAERIKRGRWGGVYPLESEADEILGALRDFDYDHYRRIGDFTVRNDHFLSFEEMYGDIGLQSNVDSTDVFEQNRQNDEAVMICGSLDKIEPNELRFLWHKKSGFVWKCRLLWAVDKLRLWERCKAKITERFRGLDYAR